MGEEGRKERRRERERERKEGKKEKDQMGFVSHKRIAEQNFSLNFYKSNVCGKKHGREKSI